MDVYYSCDSLSELERPSGIFLAGPTPRSDEVRSWRPDALSILDKQGYYGDVFVPESADGGWHGRYGDQVIWEWEALGAAACVLFWVPRSLDKMPGFTTNVEFGFIVALKPGQTVLGCPKDAPKTKYLKWLANERGNRFAQSFGLEIAPPVPICTTLEESLGVCVLLAQGRE